MTLNEMTQALNEMKQGRFGTDYAGFYGISIVEADRIAERAESAEQFEDIWESDSWWKD